MEYSRTVLAKGIEMAGYYRSGKAIYFKNLSDTPPILIADCVTEEKAEFIIMALAAATCDTDFTEAVQPDPLTELHLSPAARHYPLPDEDLAQEQGTGVPPSKGLG